MWTISGLFPTDFLKSFCIKNKVFCAKTGLSQRNGLHKYLFCYSPFVLCLMLSANFTSRCIHIQLRANPPGSVRKFCTTSFASLLALLSSYAFGDPSVQFVNSVSLSLCLLRSEISHIKCKIIK